MLTLLKLPRDQDEVLEDVSFKRGFKKAIFSYLNPLCFSALELNFILAQSAQTVFNAE